MHGLSKGLSLAVIFTAAFLGCGGTDNNGATGAGGTTGTGGTGTGTGTGGTGAPAMPTTGPYQPLTVGATWTYKVDDKGVKYDKVNLVEALEDVGGQHAGVMAYRVRTTVPSESQLTWYQVSGTQVLRLRDQDLDMTSGAVKSEDWYVPSRLRVDESPDKMMVGATWTLMYMDMHTSLTKGSSTTSETDGWKVEAIDETVTVPAGSFLALRLTHVDQSDGSTKSYWFARGVGKVREATTAGHIEELASYQVPAAQ